MSHNEHSSTNDLLKSVRRRFLILIPVILVCALIARAHVITVGGTHEYVLDSFPGVELTKDDITISPEEMLTVSSVTQDADGNTHIVFEAANPGSGMCLVSTEDSGVMFEMATSEDGVVVADGFDVTGWEYVFAALVIVIGLVGALCTNACNSLARRAYFGYEMVVYAGGVIFFLSLALNLIILFFMGYINSLSSLAMTATQAANSFVSAAILPVALIGLFVSASNAVLLRREGVGFTNLLGVVASLLFGLVLLGLWAFRTYIVDLIANYAVIMLVDSALSGIVAYAIALFLGTCLVALLAARHQPAFPRDYLIILGCGLRKDGTPTPLLAGRVDAARAYAARQVEAGFDMPTYVPSGGQGTDEACPEAEAMARYLAEKETNPRILPETRSTTTNENMAFSREVIASDGGENAPVAFATTNYHVLRGYVFAHEAGLAAEGIASSTKLYFWPNAFLREFVGMLAAQALSVAMTGLMIVALYLLAEYLLILS